MPRNICIFSDGTGQAGGYEGKDQQQDAIVDRSRSNVARLHAACGNVPKDRQICFYDAGIGSDKKAVARAGWQKYVPWEAYRWVSQATGLGISHNIIECYAALMAHWQPGDKVWLFGFSRGAYTVRSLGGVLKLCGIPARRTTGNDETAIAANIDAAAEAVTDVYMKAYYPENLQIRKNAAADFKKKYGGASECVPHFIGVWDTVRALGTPSTLPGMDFVSKQFEKVFKHEFHDATLWDEVPFARQALSIDEPRAIFAPTLWRPEDGKPGFAPGQSVKQRWFAGVHTDVGGGYADDDGLADISLGWMLDEATSVGLLIEPADCFAGLVRQNWFARQHDEMESSPPIPYTRKSRVSAIEELPFLDLHPSVLERLNKVVPKQKRHENFPKSIYNPDLGHHPKSASA